MSFQALMPLARLFVTAGGRKLRIIPSSPNLVILRR
jgi:hypothetical protein